MIQNEELLEQVIELVQQERNDEARAALAELHPADVVEVLERLEEGEKAQVFSLLGDDLAASVLAEMSDSAREIVIPRLPPQQVARLVTKMAPDAATDVLAQLEPEASQRILAAIPAEESAELRELLEHPTDSAAGIMTTDYVAVPIELSTGEAIEYIRRNFSEVGQIYMVNIVDAEGGLLGYVSLRDLVVAEPDKPVSELLEAHARWAKENEDQEDVARIMLKYDMMSMPVVDETKRLVGQVTADDVMEVMEEEATEDMFKMVGLHEDESVLSPFKASIIRRLPWLTVNVGTAFLAAAVVSAFQGTIARNAILAVFMPIVAGQGGNTGTQTLTIFVRGIALGELTFNSAKRAILKEVLLGLVNGIVIGILVAAVALAWKGDSIVGLVVGIALILNMGAAGLAGALVPLILKALRIDPALASSIFVTTITDCAGFFFFLGLASFLLEH